MCVTVRRSRPAVARECTCPLCYRVFFLLERRSYCQMALSTQLAESSAELFCRRRSNTPVSRPFHRSSIALENVAQAAGPPLGALIKAASDFQASSSPCSDGCWRRSVALVAPPPPRPSLTVLRILTPALLCCALNVLHGADSHLLVT